MSDSIEIILHFSNFPAYTFEMIEDSRVEIMDIGSNRMKSLIIRLIKMAILFLLVVL